MARSKRDTERRRAAIAVLSTRYPAAFSVDPRAIRPLKKGALEDLLVDLCTKGFASDLWKVLVFYQNSFAYLNAVAFYLRRRDLRGHGIEMVEYADRLAARDELKRRRLWTPAMENRFRSRDWIDD